uniref:NADH-ubiquinone oxidoreductase chain 1 n=1 Tax=Hypothenemus sp. BMNH 1040235 TaxID=1903787 RepID=A0A343A627_9CUCU|nr:NADH dehydrogenase subunit 1 [Hypothenemus sp. BMNH 1040235]
MLFIVNVVLFICVLVGVAFLTLFERKILSYIHIRKGPNKVGFMGLLQPFSDAIKLFTKEQSYPLASNLWIFYLTPVFSIVFMLVMWLCIPFFSVGFSFSFSLLFMLSVSSLGVYTVMLAGWSSNSNYSMLGSIRSVAQVISYEVSLVLIFLSFLFLLSSFNLFSLHKYQEYCWFIFLLFPLCFMMLISLLAETNRSPFDFAEGESELVSGFNVEYGSGGFALLFMAEYGSILLMSFIFSLFSLGGDLGNFLFFIKFMFVVFTWIWFRGTLPRYRYDKLMGLVWKIYLPVALNLFIFYFSLGLFSLFFFI